MSGKGSRQRPVADREKFNSNWDRIFGNDCTKDKHRKTEETRTDRRATDMAEAVRDDNTFSYLIKGASTAEVLMMHEIMKLTEILGLDG